MPTPRAAIYGLLGASALAKRADGRSRRSLRADFPGLRNRVILIA